MSIKNILVAYTGNESSMDALRHAMKIAIHHDAWLTAVLGHGQPLMERRMTAFLPQETLKSLREFDRQQIEEAHKAFDAVIAEQGRTAKASFVDLDTEHGSSIADFGRTFDLIVMGMERLDVTDRHMAANPDLVALYSGRPILVVPKSFAAPSLADNMLLAWDGKRSAARAVGDAMQLLEERGRVTLLTIGKAPASGTDQLIENLRRHNIDARHVHQPKKHTVGRTILDTAEAEGAKAIIMGAFEHSKFSHDLLGGVTTEVMREAKVPVFMSH